MFQLVALQTIAAHAQNLYALNDSWLSLDDFSTKEAPATPDSSFKDRGRFAARFRVINLLGKVPDTGTYKERPFHLIDDNTIGYKVTAGGRDIKVQVNKDEQPLDDVPGKVFLFGVPDGIVLVQRFEGELGYKVSMFDEWGKVRYKQVLPHTRVVEKDGEQIKLPYLLYYTHTDRYMVFNSLDSRDVNKSIVMDLKDGQFKAYDAKICGVVIHNNELAYNGYLIRDEKAKNIMVAHAGGRWSIKDDNISKVMCETVMADSNLIVARYYKSIPTINVTAYNARTGKPVWTADMKQPSGAPQRVYLSMYNNKLLVEGTLPTANFMEAFDINNGKRLYSSL
ncbi:MAG: hypothetical protein EBZ77_11155 [Chitinophagia bacterium]|nr:hypothetical protein [Chitinophagia bacterium]